MTNAVIDSVDSACYNPAEMGNGASAANLGAGRGRPRRAPPPEERQRDAHRSRQLLLAAALEEFAARGFAGARVQDIANRAGINKQLITYLHSGKTFSSVQGPVKFDSLGENTAAKAFTFQWQHGNFVQVLPKADKNSTKAEYPKAAWS